MSVMWAILSIRVENKPGILFKVTNLFRARNFNIDSISVGVMENPEFSKMTITTVGTEKQIAQIVKQLDKMIDTIEVKRLDEKESVYKELVLFRRWRWSSKQEDAHVIIDGAEGGRQLAMFFSQM